MVDWHVIGRDEIVNALIVECTQTGAKGRVPDPTAAEWDRAIYADRAAYRWGFPDRVIRAFPPGPAVVAKCPECGQADVGQPRAADWGTLVCKLCGLPVESAEEKPAEVAPEKVVSK